jgi:hypothetical protein
MDAGEVDIKERILMTRTEYSVLKEVLKYNECGWSNSTLAFPRIQIIKLAPDMSVTSWHDSCATLNL